MSCIMYISHLWIFFGALVSSNALDGRNPKCTEVTVNASLKSEAFLPCNFNVSSYNETVTVNWSRDHFFSLVKIMNNGRIFFESPSEGRVNVFPLLSEHGNFSIFIRDLQSSDIGTYTCELDTECWKVKIVEHVKINEHPNRNSELNPWWFFAAGAGLLILLFIAFSLLSKFYEKYVNTSSKSDPGNGGQSEGSNIQEERQNTELGGHRNMGGVRRAPTTVYENDIHAPNQSSAVQQGQRPQRAFRAVPETTTNHPSDVKPYYVNQAELSISANAGKKRKKQKHYQFKNPIYND
ncbi:uncharacterized protein LOC122358538 [Puntigrus tetrazona]|uniref:uncharacterized protein LOC122358538 n=1 Tax=Puntigrus tetrazona TaxID=1606681 RepID=UPI001C89FB31|nr:uncharacterized protein LOC122358538 [Puntigrus tetrazona]